MKSIVILALGIRLVGIYFILKILQFVAHSYSSIQQWKYINPGESIALSLTVFSVIGIILLILAYFLIKYPTIVAKWILPKPQSNEPVFNGSISDLNIAAFTILGVYILSWSIPDFFYNGSMIFYLNYTGVEDLYNNDSLNTHIINQVITVLEISIGLYLCLKAKGLYTLILRLRGLGTHKPSETP